MVTSASTLSVADQITGTSGTSDTINITVSGAQDAAVTLPAAAISGIEVFNVRNTVAIEAKADASNFKGITAYNSDRSIGEVTVTNLASGATAGVIGNTVVTNGAFNAGWADAVTAATLNVTGGTLGTGVVTLTGLGVTSTVVNSNGATNAIGALTLAASNKATTVHATTKLTTGALTNAGATITVDGAGAVSFGATALEAGVTKLDASANTGGLTVKLGTAVTQTVLGSTTGNDVITTSGGTLLTTGSVNAGVGGTDTLVLGAVGDANTASLAAKYTNFETLRLNGTFDAALIAGITAIELTAATNAVTNLTATQALAVKAYGTAIGATTLTLANAAGTTDVLSVTLGTGLTNAAAASAGVLTISGFETLNLTTNAGPTAAVGTDRTSTITGAIVDADLTKINLAGTAFTFTDIATTKAVTIDGTKLTGDGDTVAIGLTVGGLAKAGSTITGSNFKDVFVIGAEGSTYNAGAGDDTITSTVGILTADGTTDVTVVGGTGTDTLAISDVGATLTDVQFVNVTGMEKLTTTTGSVSLTTSGSFNTAFADGVTLTTGVMANDSSFLYAGGLHAKATSITIDGTSLDGKAEAADITVTTGAGNDTVTFTGDATWTSEAGDGATITIATAAGNDTISVTIGTMAAQTTSQSIVITGGLGADTITKVGTNSTTAKSVAIFNIVDGDSLAASRDKIVGFDLAVSATSLLGDVLNFDTATVATALTSTDAGTILTHAISNGIVTFDTAAVFGTAKIINTNNLADALAYLVANVTATETAAFAYDSNNDGTNDSTIVFNNATLDSVVEVNVVALGVSATATTTTDSYLIIG